MNALQGSCSLNAREFKARRESLRKELGPLVKALVPTQDGLKIRLEQGAKARRAAEDFVAFERACCGSLGFAVRADEQDPAIWIDIKGSAPSLGAVREFESEVRNLVPRDNLMRAGVVGSFGAFVAMLCCATPMLAIGLGALGVGSAAAGLGPMLDVAAVVLLALSLGLVATSVIRRRRRAAGCSDHPSRSCSSRASTTVPPSVT